MNRVETNYAQRTRAELTAANEKLQESDWRLKEVQRVGGLGFLDWDLLTNEIVWSEETIRMYGFDPEKVKPTIQMTVDLAHPDDRELVKKELDTAIAGGNKYDIEHRIIRPDGSVIWVHAVAQPSYDEDGRPIRIFGTVIDITSRKQTELELRKHRDHLEEQVNRRTAALQEAKQRLVRETNAVAAIIDTMLHGKLVEKETATCVLEACLAATDSVYGMLCSINQQNQYDITCFNRQTLDDCVFPAAKARDPSTGMAIRGVWGWPLLHGNPLLCNDPQAHPDSAGQPEGHVPVDCFLGVPLMRNGNVAGMVAVADKPGGYTEADQETLSRLSAVMEVSQRHAEALARAKFTSAELEGRVQERTAELETSNRELESFAYSVSHDLRAPLRAIDGFSQALLDDYSDGLGAQARDYLGRVTAAARRMAQLIDDLLGLSRVTRADMRRELVDLSAIARETAEELRETLPGRQVTFVIGAGVEAWGDPPLLRLALQNLLGNAFKFTGNRSPARIEFGALEQADQTTYFVRDDGTGFDMAYAGKLFAPFQRLHSRTEYPGTGVGLATVQRIVHRHGGRVWGEGEVDRGATFYFTLLPRKDTR